MKRRVTKGKSWQTTSRLSWKKKKSCWRVRLLQVHVFHSRLSTQKVLLRYSIWEQNNNLHSFTYSGSHYIWSRFLLDMFHAVISLMSCYVLSMPLLWAAAISLSDRCRSTFLWMALHLLRLQIRTLMRLPEQRCSSCDGEGLVQFRLV